MRLPQPSKKLARSLPTSHALVANVLGKRSNILGLDFEGSLEGWENKRIVLVG